MASSDRRAEPSYDSHLLTHPSTHLWTGLPCSPTLVPSMTLSAEALVSLFHSASEALSLFVILDSCLNVPLSEKESDFTMCRDTYTFVT